LIEIRHQSPARWRKRDELEDRSGPEERARLGGRGAAHTVQPIWGVVVGTFDVETEAMSGLVDAQLARRRRDALIRSVARADAVADAFGAASARLRSMVPFDAAAWVSTDPGTGLPNGPTVLDGVEGVSAAQCSEHWRREFLEDDVNLFRDLARATAPAAGLRRVSGDPRRSHRYRSFLRPLGFDDELRVVLRSGATPWGTITLMRRDGQPPFTQRETELVASLSQPLGEALRTRSQGNEPLRRVRVDEPGLLLFGPDGELASVNEQARAWLAEIPPDQTLPSALGVDVPLWLTITVFQAAAGGQGDGSARSRIRTRDGGWLVCHATCLRTADGASGEVAVVVEPARPAEIAPIVIDAYDLTDREQQITRLIARGAGTTEISDELYLSPHTVRGHVKAIFRKLEVTSRGELVAKLFAETYETGHRSSIEHIDTSSRIA
jgi:DNA-binding CsgD family transcriptional regulator